MEEYRKLQPKPKTSDQFKLALQTIWEEQPQKHINKAVANFTKRLTACAAVNRPCRTEIFWMFSMYLTLKPKQRDCTLPLQCAHCMAASEHLCDGFSNSNTALCDTSTLFVLQSQQCYYLDIFVNAPRSCFSIVDRFDGGLSDSSQVSSTEQPRNAGLHRHRVDRREVVVVKLQRIECFYYYISHIRAIQ